MAGWRNRSTTEHKFSNVSHGNTEDTQIGIKKSPKLLWRIFICSGLRLAQTTICNYFLTYITSFTALTTRSAFGKLAAIKVGEYGSGTSAQVIRKTGASK